MIDIGGKIDGYTLKLLEIKEHFYNQEMKKYIEKMYCKIELEQKRKSICGALSINWR